MAFLVNPFLFFYYEEKQEEEQISIVRLTHPPPLTPQIPHHSESKRRSNGPLAS